MRSFEEFAAENVGRYPEDGMSAAYDRYWKSNNGTRLTLEEFIAEVNLLDRALAVKVYSALYHLHKDRKISAFELYNFAKFRWCINHPEAIVSYDIFNGAANTKWFINNCDTVISESDAIVRVNKEWGFEASRVAIVGTPYYEATDWQCICFECAGVVWLWADEDLNQVFM